ncbi:MAG: hypothetical protein MUE40_10750 [Anaerolineae bacterium]|jgi:hypothetical protein|nr:hypothetical protein [Anaerolineae bacterium]
MKTPPFLFEVYERYRSIFLGILAGIAAAIVFAYIREAYQPDIFFALAILSLAFVLLTLLLERRSHHGRIQQE